jgi:potassium efflux system protein
MVRAPLSPDRSCRGLVALACVCWCCGLFAAPADAARQPALPTGGAGDAAVAASEAAVEIVAAPEIPMRADLDERFAQDVIAGSGQLDPAASLSPRLAGISSGIAGLNESLRRQDLSGMPVVRLESVAKHWRFYDRELEEWRQDLESAMAPVAQDAAALARRRLVWEATGQALREDSARGALPNRVRGILAQIELAERALSKPLEAQIRLGRRANAVQASIAAGRNRIGAAIEQYDRRLRTLGAPPVWEAWRINRFTPREIYSAEAGLRIEAGFLREWAAVNPDRLLGYAITVAALLPLLLWLAWRNRGVQATEPGHEAAARVLRRPVSAWLVLALVGLPFFFPDAPVILHQFALLLAVVPILRLLPQRVYDLLGSWPYIATALYVVYRLNFLLLGHPLYHRLYLLLVAVVTAAALAGLLVSSRNALPGVPVVRLREAVRAAGWLAVAVLAGAILANVVGYVTLADMLTGAVVDTAYVGLALFAGAHVLASVLSLVMARRSSSRFRLITRHTGPLLAALTKLIGALAVVIWVIAAAHQFRVARPLLGRVKAVLTYPLEAGQISITLGSVLLFGFAVWLAFWIAKTVRVVLRDEVLPKMALPRGVDNSVSTLSYYALIVVGLAVALAAAGFQASQFAIVFGALGVGIGFGLQNIVNNFVSGLILMFERPIQPGDVVEVSGTSGTVRDIGMRATTLTTGEGADVIVPNGTLLSEKLINWTLSDMNRRIDVEVGVAYGSDPRRVITLLREVAEGTPGIVADPSPAIVFKGFGPSSLDFGIRSWTHDFADWVSIRTEMTARVYETLQREGVEIPFPQQDMNLRSISPEAAARLAGTGPAAPPGTQPATEC